jgi:predicted RNase H-like HicB family nuclease
LDLSLPPLDGILGESRDRLWASINRGEAMNKHRFTVVLERGAEGGFHAFCPSLKGCFSEGDTVDEAVANVREAIEAYLESLAARGEPIPVEDLG